MKQFIITLQIVLLALLISCTELKSKKEYLTLFESEVLEQSENLKISKDADLTEIFKLKNTKENRIKAVDILDKLKNTDDTTAYLKAYQKVLSFARQTRDLNTQIDLKDILSTYYYRKGKLDSAFAYLVRKENLTLYTSDSLEMGKTAFSKGKILFETGIYTESERECLYAIKLISKFNEPLAYFQAIHLLALNLTELNQYSEADKLFHQSLELVQKNKFNDEDYQQYLISNIYNNLSHLYYHTQNYTEAKIYALKGINQDVDKERYKSLYSNLLLNYVQAKIALKEYEHIDDYFEKIIATERQLKTIGLYIGGLANTLLVQAKYLQLTHESSKAINKATESYEIANNTNRKQEIRNALAFLATYDNDNQQIYLQKLIEISDHITLQERLTKNKFARIEYQAEKLTKTNNKLVVNNKLIVIISSLLIFVLIITVYSISQAAKNKRLSLKQKHQKANEEIYKLILEQKEYADNATYSERKRIAKELHDGIINRIFTARFHLMQLCSNSEDQKKLLVAELHKAEQEIRTISHLLNKKQDFDSDPFDSLLKDLVNKQANSFNTTFTVHIDKKINWSLLSSEQKLNIYRILQEALQNINIHAKATFANITIAQKSATTIEFKIFDNGIGFDKENYRKPYRGMGLKNIKYRAKELQSTLKIHSTIGNGVEITFTIYL